jgi:hypothetical protein
MPKQTVWRFKNATSDGEDVLIFNAGHKKGDLHVYTHEKSVPAEEVEQRAEEEFGHSHDQPYLPKALGKLEFGTGHGKMWRIEDH